MTLYQVIAQAVDGTAFNNPIVSAFYYDVDDLLPSSAVATDLADQFDAVVLDTVAGIPSVLHAATAYQSVVVTSPFDPTVLGIEVVNKVGQRAGTAMPLFVAWGFKSQRTRADIRAGFKRFGRVTEADTGGELPTAGALTVLNTLAGTLSQQLVVTDGVSEFRAIPIIVKRIKYVTPEGNDAYRLPTSPLEYQFSRAENWNFDRITTQNSRKN